MNTEPTLTPQHRAEITSNLRDMVTNNILEHGVMPRCFTLLNYYSAEDYARLQTVRADAAAELDFQRQANGVMMSELLATGVTVFVAWCSSDAVESYAREVGEDPKACLGAYAESLIARYNNDDVIDKPPALEVIHPPVSYNPTPLLPEYLMLGEDTVVRMQEPRGVMVARADGLGPKHLQWWYGEYEEDEEETVMVRCAREMWGALRSHREAVEKQRRAATLEVPKILLRGVEV